MESAFTLKYAKMQYTIQVLSVQQWTLPTLNERHTGEAAEVTEWCLRAS